MHRVEGWRGEHGAGGAHPGGGNWRKAGQAEPSIEGVRVHSDEEGAQGLECGISVQARAQGNPVLKGAQVPSV